MTASPVTEDALKILDNMAQWIGDWPDADWEEPLENDVVIPWARVWQLEFHAAGWKEGQRVP